MGQLDDKYLAGKGQGLGSTMLSRQQYLANSQRRSDAMALIEAGVGSVTSRDQIINPYELIDPSMYSQNRRGKAQYESDLAALTAFQQQQEAAYKEWYESPEQGAIRERAAGINPDLAGLDNAGSASQTSPVQTVPGSSLPTNGEVASNVISQITGIIGSLSSVASLASAFSTMSLTAEQTKNAKKVGEQLDLMNEAQLGTMIASDISDLLATAQQAHVDSNAEGEFDLDGWFANDSNFDTLTPIYGSNPRYAAQLAKQRKAVLSHQKRAAETQSGLASANWSLANIISDPRYSSDQKLTMIQLTPFVDACVKADAAEVALRESVATWSKKRQDGMDVNLAIDAANAANRASFAQSVYTEDYYNEADGELVAAYEQYFRDTMMPGLELRGLIQQGYLDMFKSDPGGEDGYKAAYLFGTNGGSSWEEVYMLRHTDDFKTLIDSKVAVAKSTGDYAELNALGTALNSFLSSTDFVDYRGTALYYEKYIGYLEEIEQILNAAGYEIDFTSSNNPKRRK